MVANDSYQDLDVLGQKRAEASSRVWQTALAKESMLKQKAKHKWIAKVDSNSKFIHRVMKKIFKRNNLLGIRMDNGWVDHVKHVKLEVKNHFEFIF